MNLSAENIIKLLQVPGIGRARIFNIDKIIPEGINDEQTISDILQENASVLRIPTITRDVIISSFSKGQQLFDLSLEKGVKLISFSDELYPEQLKNITSPPVLLHSLGNIASLSEMPCVAVIGTRYPSQHGKLIGERIGFRLGESQINVVSGLAIGCDTAGHIGCLRAKGVTTAVLAHGLDSIYPKENSGLAQSILDNNGCLISEYAIKTKGNPNYFVERDRIQAGLSLGTVVVETDVKGGTMITVRNTLEYKRILAAYHHPIEKQNEKSRGNEMLISNGSALQIQSLEDINDLIKKVNPNYFKTLENNNSRSIEGIQMPAFDLDELVIKDYKLKEKKKKAPKKKLEKKSVIQKKLYDNEDRSDL